MKRRIRSTLSTLLLSSPLRYVCLWKMPLMKRKGSLRVGNGVRIGVNKSSSRIGGRLGRKKCGNGEKKNSKNHMCVGSQHRLQCTSRHSGYLSAVRWSLHDHRGEEPERHRWRHYRQLPSSRHHLQRNAGNPWSTAPIGWPGETEHERECELLCLQTHLKQSSQSWTRFFCFFVFIYVLQN